MWTAYPDAMLTRLEVHGFKNLLDVEVDLSPFTCIAGANGIGKSNVFDAIEFMAHLASSSFAEAAQLVRGSAGHRGGDPRDLFWDGYRQHPRIMTLAAEMLVPPKVEDDLGAEAEAATTLLRYEVQLGYEEPMGQSSVGRITLLAEDLTHITKGEAGRHLRFPHSVRNFRDAVVIGQRRGGAFLSTEKREAGTVINVHGDGGSRGRPQPRATVRAGRTVLSTVTTNDYPTILAARREMQSWRRLALEPSALRAPDGFDAPRSLGQDGRHLASTLFRVANTARDSGAVDPDQTYSTIAVRLSELTGVQAEDIEVEQDAVREVFTLFLDERGNLRLPARALSEGTLRFLALCVLLEDPEFTGVVCMEEPENGIHPANLAAMLQVVQDLAVDASQEPGTDNPFRQVLINTHSPGVVQLCDPNDLLLAETHRVQGPDGERVSALALTPYRHSWRADQAGETKQTFAEGDVLAYLTRPSNSQLQLPLDLSA